MGILEKIVQSMTATTTNNNKKDAGSRMMTNDDDREEIDSQYAAQVDVITRLAGRVDEQLGTAKRRHGSGAVRTALIKLEGDFRRVKERVAALQGSVTAARRQAAAWRRQRAEAATDGDDNAASAESMGYEEYQRHMELQLQQDVSCVRVRALGRSVGHVVIRIALFWGCGHVLCSVASRGVTAEQKACFHRKS